VLQEGRSRLTEGEALMSVLADEGSSAPRVGADLRTARERTGYTLEEVAEGLRIRLPYLEALEDGRIADLPGTAYALGFLRTYAEALGLDADEMSRRFKDEANEVNVKTELEFPAPRPRGRLPAGAMVLLGAVLTIGAYIGWYRLSSDGRLPAEAVAPVPERLAPLAQQAIPAPGPATVAPVAVAPAPAETQAVAVPETPLVSPSQAAAAIPLPPPAPPPVTPPIAAPATAPAAAPAAADGGRIVVHVKADVWIQLRAQNGQVIFDRVLKSGESYNVPNRPGLSLTTGNALATEFVVDGAPTPNLGAIKGVRRGIALDADMIKDGRLAAQLAGGLQNVTRPQ
jgi:cytoskeleton protein RodZ